MNETIEVNYEALETLSLADLTVLSTYHRLYPTASKMTPGEAMIIDAEYTNRLLNLFPR